MATKTPEEKAAAKASRDAAKAAKAATTSVVTEQAPPTPPEPDPLANLPKKAPEPKGPRVPGAAFFATLPTGFVPPRRADYLADVITGVHDFRTDAEKVIWLRHNTSPALTYLLRLAFCKDVEWLIPAGAPIFKPWKGRRYSSPSELKRELRRLYLYIRGGNDAVADIKRQKLFAQTLEGLESVEVGVLLALKDKTLPKDYGLTDELVNLAFPGILDAPFQPKFAR
jgi:hypothetical protein